MFHKQTFIHRFILGPSFADTIMRGLATSLFSSPDLLLNVYLACSGRFASTIKLYLVGHNADIDYTNSARAVQALRTTGSRIPLQEADLITAVVLGLGIITFDLLASGLHAHSICRFTIGLAEHFYQSEQSENIGHRGSIPELDFNLSPLLFMDTVNCIVRRQVPVFRFQPQDEEVVDRYIGICSSLLPYLFDICSISHKLAASSTAERDSDVAIGSAIKERLHTVEYAILSWKPSIPNSFAVSSTAQELEVIKTQARVHQCVALLVIHRLQFPNGVQDDMARELSTMILANIANIYRGTQTAATGRSGVADEFDHSKNGVTFEYRLGFAFLVAAVEVRDPQERNEVLGQVPVVVCSKMYPNVSEMLGQFLVYIWQAQDRNRSAYWFDMVSDGPPFVLF
ncbi:hypothetical protein K469DRAFT_596065 [Zopfia rhizophila CBS 207.26]|uniref:Transcription factor domain-containing protein n=1 Tax=Zopfia rhizophila CBS 207.26 TaxID=1314779 RepID=A0A6A6DIZ8_9PEZI|nr:hypothetical protein K469DRAFT_596065 [Zopfia rhizophila CBS 207.26]